MRTMCLIDCFPYVKLTCLEGTKSPHVLRAQNHLMSWGHKIASCLEGAKSPHVLRAQNHLMSWGHKIVSCLEGTKSPQVLRAQKKFQSNRLHSHWKMSYSVKNCFSQKCIQWINAVLLPKKCSCRIRVNNYNMLRRVSMYL